MPKTLVNIRILGKIKQKNKKLLTGFELVGKRPINVDFMGFPVFRDKICDKI